MPFEIMGEINVIATISATLGLIFTGYTILKSEKTRQIQIAEDIFKNIRELEIQYYEKVIGDEEKKKQWSNVFFNTLEWFSFLINHGKLKDEEMLMFFKDAFIAYYEKIFIGANVFGNEVISDEKIFPEFKKLYKRLKYMP